MTKEFKMTKYYVRYPSIDGVLNCSIGYINYDTELDRYIIDDYAEEFGEYVTQFTSADIVKFPKAILDAIGKGVLVLEAVE
ncbi:hypothetical protein [Macrococcus capreoli]|uniref:hypothetical protein n=1 Tax=Macrococcus capreoli TaxID=2982690 RepID=UPI0021D5AACB|nr:hypothetical protein [Macrococcus sp. TMW 2.2395]MCU7556575.1 hypothetical protein [Macrococcus sp. TMW 2.2395]